MKRLHHHPCVNDGCPTQFSCDGLPDADGACSETWLQDIECLECQESRCKECGSVLRVETHDRHCTVNPNYDPTPDELPSGASVGPETRDAEAWAIKRGR